MNFTLKDIIEEDTTESTEKDEIMEIEELNEEIIERIVEAPLESYDVVDVASSAATSSQKTERIARRHRNSTLGSNFCIQCQKDFSTKTNLRRHMLTHSSQKPFQCSICGNGFTQKGSLKQHLYLHAGLRPYSCSYCQSSFTQAKTLVNHLRRHTGEKPFPCEECGINFRQKDGLKRHTMTRHLKTQQKVFSCTICNKQLNSKYSFDNHIRKHGKSEETTTDTESLEAPQKSSNDSSSECNEDFQVTKTHRVIITNSTDDSIQFLEVADESIQSKTDLYGNESS